VVEAIKYELKKYIKRERNKKRPEEVDLRFKEITNWAKIGFC
jgi:hypothetical protein